MSDAARDARSGDPGSRLADIQRWMQGVITHPGGVVEGVAAQSAGESQVTVGPGGSPDAELAARRFISPSRQLSSVERLQVYSHAYIARLVDCLEASFPVLAETLGEELFRGFAADYVREHPPSSYTLNQLADRFVPFLERTRPADAGDWADFMVELARLEWSIECVFDGPGIEDRPPLSLEDLPAAEGHGDLVLEPAPCLQLLAFEFPVRDFYRARRRGEDVRRGEDIRLPHRSPSYVAVHRREFVVRLLPLSDLQFAVLSRLVAGEPLESAIGQVAEQLPAGSETWFGEQLHGWFAGWAAEGFFVGGHRGERTCGGPGAG